MKIRRSLLKELVTVETFAGAGGYGDTFAAPVTVKAAVENSQKVLRNPAGEEIVSEARLHVHPHPRNEASGALLDAATLFTPESLVTLSGRKATVISVQANNLRGKPVFYTVVTT